MSGVGCIPATAPGLASIAIRLLGLHERCNSMLGIRARGGLDMS
jgi:hypothetical protein